MVIGERIFVLFLKQLIECIAGNELVCNVLIRTILVKLQAPLGKICSRTWISDLFGLTWKYVEGKKLDLAHK